MSTKQLIALSFMRGGVRADHVTVSYAAANPTAGLYKAPLNNYAASQTWKETWTSTQR